MKLYFHPASTFARRVRVALSEKQITCELRELDLPAREHKSDWYAKLNPCPLARAAVPGALPPL